MLDLPSGSRLRVTKRDCKTWFDQLLLHDSLRPFFGRPRVSQAELVGVGLSSGNLRRSGAAPGGNWFAPCSRVWPMGCSWSSCVAQCTFPRIASDAGFTSDLVLASDHALPDTLDLAFAVATCDLVLFSDSR